MKASVVSANENETTVGSQSYNYVIPILSLPGRAGLDLNLNLYYNSRIWDVDTNAGTITFNADRDFPSYGFRLDFGFVEYDPAVDEYILTEADGTKRQLPNAGGSYDTTDGSFINFNPSTKILTYKNGTAVFYEPFYSQQSASPPVLFRPYIIEDTNGNALQIFYVAQKDQAIDHIRDTLGRDIYFTYTSGKLTDIRQNVAVSSVDPSGVHVYATFDWITIYPSSPSPYVWYAFTGLTPNAVPTGPLNVIDFCRYANGTKYQFTYGDWGIVNRIDQLSSTGLARSYVSYNFPSANQGALSDAPAYTTETVSNGTSTANWNYSTSKAGTGVVTSMSVSDPAGNTSTTTLDSNTGLLSSVQLKDGSNKVWSTTSYTWKTSGSSTVPDTVITTNDSGQQSKTQYSYDSYGNVTDLAEYDFGLTLVRHTITTYLVNDPSGSGYLSKHILQLPMEVQVKDASGNIKARAAFAYDTTGFYNSTDINANGHDNTHYGVGSPNTNVRGNQTSITRYSDPVSPSGAIIRTFVFDTLGNLRKADVDCCNQKIFNFSSQTQWAYPDSVVRGKTTQFTSSFTYNIDKGLMLTSTDENSQVTSYAYDSMNRTISVTGPANSATSVQVTANTAYGDDVLSPTVTNSNTGANSLVTMSTFDGLGHTLQVDTKNNTTPVSTVKYGYNNLGQRIQASNPFGPNETQINTAFAYDAIGRVTIVTPPSGGFTQYTYSGNTMTVTDPAGKQRKSYTDALGRLIEVDEPGVPGVGQAVSHAVLQSDGNFVISSPDNTPLWSTQTYGTTIDTGLLQPDGNFVLYSQIWSVGTYVAPSGVFIPYDSCRIADELLAGQTLASNSCIESQSGQYLVLMQSDGNFFIYNRSNGNISFASNTYGNPGAYGVMQSDGDFVIYAADGSFLWDSGTSGQGGKVLRIIDDGRLIIYKDFWQSNTSNPSAISSSMSAPSCGSAGVGLGWGSVIQAGSCLVSYNGRFELLMQTDGNLVLYDRSTTPATATWSSNTPLTSLTPGVALKTTYTYDVLDHLTGVSQAAGLYNGQSGAAQSRSYVYDALSRMASITTPESGTVTNYYAKADGTACSDDPTLVCRIQDARGVGKTFSYDSINRLSSVQYSDGTATQSYEYDNTTGNPYALDRLTKITEGMNSQAFTYDNWGQITKVSHVIDGTTYPVQYGYNGAGQISSLAYPTGLVIMQNYDAIGRVTSICDGSGTNCTGTTYLSGITYNAAFQPTAVTYGNNDQGTFGYNDHLQISTLRYTHPGNSADILNVAYDFGQTYNGVTVNNGQLQKIRYYTSPGVENTTKSEYFTYDQLGRLSAAQTATVSSSTPGTWNLAWNYDRFGNRLQQTLMGGNTTGTDIGQTQITVDPATNRITNAGFSYDASGNLLADGTHTYSYDALNRMKQVDSGAVSSTYFGQLRIKKVSGSTTTIYIYSDSTPIAEYVNGGLSKEYVYSGAKILAEISSGTITYHHSDHLSNRADTDAAGHVSLHGHAPFGENWYDDSPTKLKFTTYERDSETRLDYAQFRYYASGLGRFTSADLLNGTFDDPQSLNRFAYSRNDPVNFTDPLGLTVVMAWVCSYRMGSIDNGEGGTREVFGFFCEQTLIDIPDGPPPTIDPGGVPDNPCNQKIIDAINKKLGTNLTTSNITSAGLQNNTQGRGNEWNVHVSANSWNDGLTASQFNAIQPNAHFAMGTTAAIFGWGSTLHIAGTGLTQHFFDPSATFSSQNIGGQLSAQFTAHLDSANAYHPVGFFMHIIRDVLFHKHRNPCP